MEPMSRLVAEPLFEGRKPALDPGVCVADQYEIRGVLAHGAAGWIYLAWDRVLSRWAVLKGLLRAADEESVNQALAERQFLAAVKHPNIVSIYNFARYGGDGFIVMEYVDGRTLKAVRAERGPLPVPEAIAYIHRILNAFAYLHRQRLLFCDFKLENCMVEADDVKLIDLGFVRRMDDTVSGVYGTVGYAAPDGAETPSVASDLYTVGRSLAIMVGGFDLFGDYVHTLPGPDVVPAFARHPALYAFLQKATHPEPDRRFQNADDMATQLLGVLREVTAGTGPARTLESVYFFAADQVQTGQRSVGPRSLPALKPDSGDPAATALLSASALEGEARMDALRAAMEKYPESVEAPIRIADVHIEHAEYSAAEGLLDIARTRDNFDWRAEWLKGKTALLRNKPAEAFASFERVAADLPGELIPRFALAIAAEAEENWKTAARWFDVVSNVDPANVAATLGYARCLERLHDTEAAVAAYQRVPATSSAYSFAQLEMTRVVLRSPAKAPGITELTLASRTVEALALEGRALHDIRAEVFIAALDAIAAGRVVPASDTMLLGTVVETSALRLGAEGALRGLARVTHSTAERVTLVQRANALRPVSWS